MRIKRRHLNTLIESLLNEVGLGVGMDPTGATMPRGMKRSEYNQLGDAYTDPQSILAALSVIDPTMITDFISCFLYLLVGDYKSAATVVVFSGMGVGAGAAGAKGISLAKKSEEGLKISLKKNGIPESKANEMVDELKHHVDNNITHPSKPIPTDEAVELANEVFRKFNRANPKKASEKVVIPGRTGRVALKTREGRLTTLSDEYDAMVRMNKILPKNSVKPIRIVNDSYIDMERMSGVTLEQMETALKNKRLEKGLDEIDIMDIKSIKKQLEDIREILFSHKYFQHGDLHAGNIFIEDNGTVKLFDPAGLRAGEMAKKVDDTMLGKHIRFLRSMIDNPQKPGANIGSLLQKESLYRLTFPTKY